MNQAYHTPAISLNLMDNALLRNFTGRDDYYIETTNHPLPKTEAQLADEEAAANFGWSFMVSSNILFGFAFLVCMNSHISCLQFLFEYMGAFSF